MGDMTEAEEQRLDTEVANVQFMLRKCGQEFNGDVAKGLIDITHSQTFMIIEYSMVVLSWLKRRQKLPAKELFLKLRARVTKDHKEMRFIEVRMITVTTLYYLEIKKMIDTQDDPREVWMTNFGAGIAGRHGLAGEDL